MYNKFFCIIVISIITLGTALANEKINAGYSEVQTIDPVTEKIVRAAVWYPTQRPWSHLYTRTIYNFCCSKRGLD